MADEKKVSALFYLFPPFVFLFHSINNIYFGHIFFINFGSDNLISYLFGFHEVLAV